jgi:hypothetical protein
MGNTDSNDPMRAYTPEEVQQIRDAFDIDPVATVNALAQGQAQAAFAQTAQLSAQHVEEFRDSVFEANLSRATDEIAASVGYDAYNAALPRISELWGDDPSLIASGQSYETIRNRLAGLFNSAAVGLNVKSAKEAEDESIWNRIKNAPGTQSYQDLANSQGR